MGWERKQEQEERKPKSSDILHSTLQNGEWNYRKVLKKLGKKTCLLYKEGWRREEGVSLNRVSIRSLADATARPRSLASHLELLPSNLQKKSTKK